MGMGFGWVTMLLFWAVVIFGVLAVVRWWGPVRPNDRDAKPETPLDIIEKRYARGEINKEEYEQKRKDLTPH